MAIKLNLAFIYILIFEGYTKSESITTKTTEVFLLDNWLLVIRFLDNDIEVDYNEVKEQIEAGKKLTGNKKAPVLVDVRESFHTLTPEAKELAASEDKKLAEAILLKAFHQRIIASFFLKLSHKKNNHPVKIFTNQTEAINWLKQFSAKQ